MAYAWDFTPPPDPFNVCPAIDGFTKRIVYCIRNSALVAVNDILGDLFSYFYGALAACITVAVALWGILMATGRSTWSIRVGFMLALKIAVIILLFTGVSYNFTILYGQILDAIGELLGYLTIYIDFSPSFSATCSLPLETDPSLIVWDRVDCALHILIGGILGPYAATFGLGAFFLSSIVTDAFGLFIAMLGFFMIIQFVFAIIRAVYIFIMSYMAFSLMALVAPLFLPLLLFRVTKGYFEKWLKLTIGFVLQPIFIFVYLAMLLAAYDTVIYTGPYSLFNTLTPYTYLPGAEPYPPIGPLLRDSGSYSEGRLGNTAFNYDVEHAAGHPDTCPQPPDPCPFELDTMQTGVADNLGEVTTEQEDWDQLVTGMAGNIYDALGIEDYFFFVNIPVQAVDWEITAANAGFIDYEEYPPGSGSFIFDTTWFLTSLLLTLIMAVATTYIFMLLLDSLPFIGSGISDIAGTMNPAAGMTGFGFGGLGPPGESMITGMRKKIFGGG